MSVDLSTTYLGLTLRNPLVAAASPLTSGPETLRQLYDAGASAVVLPSLFEEQIEHEAWAVHQMHEFQTESFAESLDWFPEMDTYNTGPDFYLERIEDAKQTVDIPVIASLNGDSAGGWTRYATMIEQAGADALELNIYMVPGDPDVSGYDVEQRYVELLSSVRQSLTIPLAVKIGPWFSSFPCFARQLADAGADGLVLFNRYLEPDIDLETLRVEPKLELSQPSEMRLPLRWIAILHGRVDVSLAATSGVHAASDALKLLLAGADVAMLASVLLQNGPACLQRILHDMQAWLEEHEYQSVKQLKGSVSQQNCGDPRAWERLNYMKALISYSGKQV
jgi:dihydroorotate dehydrogenase (fumarate)